MDYNVALKKLGGQSVGGQLIVNFEGRNVLVGRHYDGMLIAEETDEARAVLGTLGDAPASQSAPARRGKKAATAGDPPPVVEPDGDETETSTEHALDVEDGVDTEDAVG